jgi:hypothetical protein
MMIIPKMVFCCSFSQFRHRNNTRDSDRELNSNHIPNSDGVSLGIGKSAKKTLPEDLARDLK